MSPNECNEIGVLLTGYADGELSPEERAVAERHVKECPRCARALESISTLKTALRDETLLYNIPGALKSRIDALVDKAGDGSPAKPKAKFPKVPLKLVAIAAGAGISVAAIIAGYEMVFPSAAARLEGDALRAHASAVKSGLTGIRSSDAAVVVQWLSSRVGFAPLLPSRLPSGFSLVGGRVDRLGGEAAAVVVYGNGSQIAEVYQRAALLPPGAASNESSGGVGATAWSASGRDFVVISDGGVGSATMIADQFVVEGCGPK